jgi:hypothetical protein
MKINRLSKGGHIILMENRTVEKVFDTRPEGTRRVVSFRISGLWERGTRGCGCEYRGLAEAFEKASPRRTFEPVLMMMMMEQLIVVRTLLRPDFSCS